MDLADLDYDLPKGFIANYQAKPRDTSRFLVVSRSNGRLLHYRFRELENLLSERDVLVLNQSKVFPARLKFIRSNGREGELLLIKSVEEDTWEAMSKPGLRVGQQLKISEFLSAVVMDKDSETGYIIVRFNKVGEELQRIIDEIGLVPIPPYVTRNAADPRLKQEYQTVYATKSGSVAAPTAGLHFTKSLLNKLKQKGVQIEYVTLHVGPGTFQNLREENIKTKFLHIEEYEIQPDVSWRLNEAKRKGKRIVTVGTTTTRVLETSVLNAKEGIVMGGKGETGLFIYPPYKFKFVDSLITNFHLPKSSLLMLVSAFVSVPNTAAQFKDFRSSLIGKVYREAIRQKCRFYSFGDAMWIQ